jgi:hypothetical protein
MRCDGGDGGAMNRETAIIIAAVLIFAAGIVAGVAISAQVTSRPPSSRIYEPASILIAGAQLANL